MPSHRPKNITILGAGVTGLQTALTLSTSTSPPSSITIIAQHLPGTTAPTYTSPWAGGHWRSHASSSSQDALPRAWDARTYAAWRDLLENGDGTPGCENESKEEREKRIGLGVRGSFNGWGEHTEETGGNGEGLWWSKDVVVRGFEVLGEEELKSHGGERELVFGVRYESICINVPRYLVYLYERIQGLGVKVINTTFETEKGLEGVVRDVGRIMKENEREKPDVIVNATGLGARHFVDEEERKRLVPIRGQTILVRGEAHSARTITNFGLKNEVAYVIPRVCSGTTILGGCKQAASNSSEIDEELSKRILQRIKDFKLADELLNENGEFEVLSTQVGFRPGRMGGPRCEREERRVGGFWVVHGYGHAGAGYQNSVGCAERVREIVNDLGEGRESKL